MAKKANINPTLFNFLTKKAKHSPCTYRLAAVAISKKGNILGHCTNNHSKWQVLEKTPIGRAGTAQHCERLLIQKYGQRIHTIIICRIGRSGEIRPIDPCPACAKLANKYGITIKTVQA